VKEKKKITFFNEHKSVDRERKREEESWQESDK